MLLLAGRSPGFEVRNRVLVSSLLADQEHDGEQDLEQHVSHGHRPSFLGGPCRKGGARIARCTHG
jgi:hypothetical protein